jgi:glutathione S-transferase
MVPFDRDDNYEPGTGCCASIRHQCGADRRRGRAVRLDADLRASSRTHTPLPTRRRCAAGHEPHQLELKSDEVYFPHVVNSSASSTTQSPGTAAARLRAFHKDLDRLQTATTSRAYSAPISPSTWRTSLPIARARGRDRRHAAGGAARSRRPECRARSGRRDDGFLASEGRPVPAFLQQHLRT